jgi:hypothetical protein
MVVVGLLSSSCCCGNVELECPQLNVLLHPNQQCQARQECRNVWGMLVEFDYFAHKMEDDGVEAFEESFFPTSDWVVRRLQQKHDPTVAERVLNIYLWGSRYRILLFIYLFCLLFIYIFLTFFFFPFCCTGCTDVPRPRRTGTVLLYVLLELLLLFICKVYPFVFVCRSPATTRRTI